MCPLCGRRTENAQPHPSCISTVDNRLAAIPGLYAGLATALVPGSAVDMRVSGTPALPVPISLEPLSLQCRGGIVSILATWESDWRERRGFSLNPARDGHEQLLTGARVLTDVVTFLRAHLGWAVREHPAVDEFDDEVREITAACRATLGETLGHMRIGRCPAQLGERTCGRVLYADPYADSIRCERCRTDWPRARWLLLGAALAETDAA